MQSKSDNTRIITNTPRSIWIIYIATAFIVFSVFSWILFQASARENSRLIERELELLVRANKTAIQSGNYRKVLESLGSEYLGAYFTLTSQGKVFSFGVLDQSLTCASLASNESTFKLCRPLPIPSNRLWILIFIFSALGFVTYFIGSRMEVIYIERERYRAADEVAKQVLHDIKSPMTALGIIIESSGKLESELRSLLEMSSSRVIKIVESLENRFSSESSENETRTDLGEVVQLVVREKLVLPKVKSSIVFDLRQPPSSPIVHLDPDILKRLLSNILNNSIESISTSGKIRIEIETKENHALILIEDTGCGISSANMNKIGKKFATFGKVNGQGLGLFYAKSNIERWGGTFAIESEAGVGTRVKLSIPIIPQKQHSPANVISSFSSSRTSSLQMYTP